LSTRPREGYENVVLHALPMSARDLDDPDRKWIKAFRFPEWFVCQNEDCWGATAFGHAPELPIRDRDGSFLAVFDRFARGVSVRVLRTASEAPLLNAVCERIVGGMETPCA